MHWLLDVIRLEVILLMLFHFFLEQRLMPPTGYIMWLIWIFQFENFISTGGQGCFTGGPPMTMNGIPNKLPPNFSLRWPGIEHI